VGLIYLKNIYELMSEMESPRDAYPVSVVLPVTDVVREPVLVVVGASWGRAEAGNTKKSTVIKVAKMVDFMMSYNKRRGNCFKKKVYVNLQRPLL